MDNYCVISDRIQHQVYFNGHSHNSWLVCYDNMFVKRLSQMWFLKYNSTETIIFQNACLDLKQIQYQRLLLLITPCAMMQHSLFGWNVTNTMETLSGHQLRSVGSLLLHSILYCGWSNLRWIDMTWFTYGMVSPSSISTSLKSYCYYNFSLQRATNLSYQSAFSKRARRTRFATNICFNCYHETRGLRKNYARHM